MPRNQRARGAQTIPIWTCPHCGHRHTPATFKHAGDGQNFRCQNADCKKLYNVLSVYFYKKDVPELL